MNTITGKLFIQSYYNGSETMVSKAYNQDNTKETTDVEMITLSLHDDNGVVETQEAMLKTDGTFSAEFAASEEHYLSVRGVNSLEVFSNGKVNVTDPTNYDFTVSGATLGNNVVEVESGVFAILSGDINGDGVIDATDVGLLTIAVSNSDYGVQATDLNGDGVVDNSDSDNLWTNLGKSVIKPY